MLNIFLIGKKIIRGLNNSCMSEIEQRAKSGTHKYRKIKRKKYQHFKAYMLRAKT